MNLLPLLLQIEGPYLKIPEDFTIKIVLIAVLIIASSFLYGAEIAITSLSRVRVREMMEKNIRGSNILHGIVDNKNYSITSIFTAILVLILLADNVSYEVIANFSSSKLEVLILTTVFIALMILFWGEVIFKTLSINNIDKFASFSAEPVWLITVIFYPLSWIIINISFFIAKLFGIKIEQSGEAITEDHIRLLVEEGEEQGVFEEHEKEMIHSIIDFGDTIAREVMVPRISMVCVNVKEKIDRVLRAIVETGYSRIPIYEDTIDNIVGIVYAKDLLKTFFKEEKFGAFIKDVMRPVYFTPEIKKVNDLFKEMKQERISMAIVVDEYGGTDGLITIEDLIEEIVGEIEDEYDHKSPVIEKLSDAVFMVDARMNIEDVNSNLDINLPVDECESIGGYVYGLLGRIPAQGEEVKVDAITIIVEKIQRRMIKKLKIKKIYNNSGRDSTVDEAEKDN